MTSPTAEEYQRLVEFLNKSRSDLHQAVEGLDEKVCSEKLNSEAWSITGIVEHLSILERKILRMLQTKLAQAELAPELDADSERRDELVSRRTESRLKKLDAPDAVRPTGRYPNVREALNVFDAARQTTIDYAKSEPPFLRGRYLPHMAGGLLDGYQWLLLLAAHTERHIRQIEETKSAFEHV
jgi:hypothetical protein